MIILDTNLISEPLKPTPDPAVLAWLDAQPIETLYLTTISLAELRYGIAALQDGKRKQGLTTALDQRVIALLAPRILPFTIAAADAYAAIRARAKRAGKAIVRLTVTSQALPLPTALRSQPAMPRRSRPQA